MVTFARKRKLKIGASQNKIKFGVSKETQRVGSHSSSLQTRTKKGRREKSKKIQSKETVGQSIPGLSNL